MKKWITSNYHYMVPEFDETTKVTPDFTRFLANCVRGVGSLGAECGVPVLMGPVSLVRLTKISAGATTKEALLATLIPVYKKVLEQL